MSELIAILIFLNLFFYLQLDGEEADVDTEDEPDFYTEAPLPG
jgi:hypothetical protein